MHEKVATLKVKRTRKAGALPAKRVHFLIADDIDSAELLNFLESLPWGSESAWWRGIGKRWLAEAQRRGEVNQALIEVLNESEPGAWGTEAGAEPQNDPLSCSVAVRPV